MRKIYFLLIVLFALVSAPIDASAQRIFTGQVTYDNNTGGSAMQELSDSIYEMSKNINKASSQMMRFGDMLFCSSLHGKAADWTVEVAGFVVWEKRIINISLWFSSIILIGIGFLISIAASFYMFDVAFNLGISIVLLPLAIALWPFGWTKSKLKQVIESITYYTGVFIFLPLGVLIANEIVWAVVESVFGGTSLEAAFKNDQSDLIEDNLSLFTLGFLKVLLSYIIAFKIIPLMASEFCGHFFGEAMAGNPINQRITQALGELKKRTVGKAGKYMKDVAKHQAGNMIKKAGDKNGNFLQRAVHRMGSNVGKTKK